ncbi:MAG: starch-binding protein [Muribaculaceae bacterium]|nr:starch-binding protein [Muribaculaceae bacterium]
MLLAFFATAWSTNAWAITINVNVTGNQAPYVYAWDNNQTPLLDPYPGTQLTNTKNVGDKTWYYIEIDAETANVILSFGTDETKTGDIYVNGNRFFEFANNNANNVTDYYDTPDGVGFHSEPFTYVVNASKWSGDLYAYAWGNGYSGSASSWPGEKMTKVGTNGNGNDVYVWISDSQTNPANLIFNNDSGSQTSDLTWVNGAYWSNYAGDSRMTISGIILNSTNVPDANLRKAITYSTGIAEGEAITANNIKVLDISYDTDKGMTGKIANPTGIEHFTYLEELYARDNNITYADLTALTNLRKLDLHGNSGLKGFGKNAASTNNPILNLPPAESNSLEYIDISNCAVQYCSQEAFADRVASSLETLIVANNYDNYHFGEVTALNTLSKLKYFDMSGCDGNPHAIVASFSSTQKGVLEYLDISNQHMTTTGADPALDGFTALKTFKFNSQATWTKALSINNCPVLTYIDLSGNVAMTGLTINNCGITSLNFPEATTLSTLTHLATLDASNNPFTVLNIPQTPNTLLTVTANDCSTMTRILAEHNASKLQYVTAQNCPALTDITINGADIYFNKQINAFDATNKSTLVTLDLSNDAMSTNYALDGFTALQTVDFDNNYMDGNNNNLQSFTAINCPALTTINLGGNANMHTVTLTNNSFSNSNYPLVTVDAGASNVVLDFSDNNFTDVPNIQASQINVLKLNNNQLTDINIPNGCNVNYLYAQNNNFGSGAYTLPQTSLVGLDLGNNGFTKFKAENNTSLKSLALADNTGLTEIELHWNTALTQTSPDGVIESDNGLYIKGLSSLQTLNIENSSFNKLGQQNSLQGVTGLTKLQARHNEFTTFTNGVYNLDVAGDVNYRVADPNESSLEYLTALEYLDLAYNNLQDSVHLYRNVALKHLDVSHNNEIHGVIDGTINPNDEAAVEAMIIKKGKNFMKYGRVYGKDPNNPNAKPMPGWNPSAAEWTAGYTNLQALRERPFDLRIEDLNDTIGLYHLDLGKNVNLEWVDISYTNIHNTSAGPTHMNPGWMDTDWVTDMGTFAGKPSQNTTTHRAYVSWHTFVYFIPCTNLKVIHTDHNNMRSLGVRYFPELDTLTCSYMYGDSEIMRDFNGSGDLRYGMGNTGTQTSIKKFQRVDWAHHDKDGYPIIELVGPNGTTADSDVYPSKLRYWDLSYSGYNEVRLYPGSAFADLPYLEYLDVSGNPLNFTTHAFEANYASVSNWNSLDLTYCPNIRTVKADNCSDLPIVRAHNRPVLDTLYLSNDPNLKALYVQNDPLLKTNFVGLSTLTGLEILCGYNNTHWGNDITFSSNTALKNLWISNIGATTLDVTDNIALEKLRAYDNGLTSLDLSENENLLWLDVARNKLPNIDLGDNTKLEFFNISNGSDTRTQLDGSERLNHDGSDGDAIYPTTVYSDDEAPVASADAGNSLSDLVLPASIIDARANGNDLHSITGSFANLTNIEFAHNHINGISLPSGVTVDSRDNGRTILADCSKFIPHGDFGNEVTVYFFQIDPNETGNGTVLTDRDSKDIKNKTRYLGDDGLDLGKITGWTSDAAVLTANAGGKNVTLNPDNMGQYLDPSQVPGTIVVLAEDPNNPGEGKAQYSYSCSNNSNNRDNNATFYLNWSSDGTVTGINSVIGDDGFDLAGTYGGIVVAGKDGTVVGVYDTNGRQIASETISGGKLTIDGLAPGIYIVNGVKVLVK